MVRDIFVTLKKLYYIRDNLHFVSNDEMNGVENIVKEIVKENKIQIKYDGKTTKALNYISTLKTTTVTTISQEIINYAKDNTSLSYRSNLQPVYRGSILDALNGPYFQIPSARSGPVPNNPLNGPSSLIGATTKTGATKTIKDELKTLKNLLDSTKNKLGLATNWSKLKVIYDNFNDIRNAIDIINGKLEPIIPGTTQMIHDIFISMEMTRFILDTSNNTLFDRDPTKITLNISYDDLLSRREDLYNVYVAIDVDWLGKNNQTGYVYDYLVKKGNSKIDLLGDYTGIGNLLQDVYNKLDNVIDDAVTKGLVGGAKNDVGSVLLELRKIVLISDVLQAIKQLEAILAGQDKSNIAGFFSDIILNNIANSNNYDIQLFEYLSRQGFKEKDMINIHILNRRTDIADLLHKIDPNKKYHLMSIMRLKKLSAETNFFRKYKINDRLQIDILTQKIAIM